MKTRFAPSPTGSLHIGGVRTALFNWLLARHHGGTFLLRIGDTDPIRSDPAHTQQIIESLNWLGIQSDAEPWHQSQRFDVYQDHAQALVEQGLAYRCTCNVQTLDALRAHQQAHGLKPGYDGRCRDQNIPATTPHAIRLKTPAAHHLTFEDSVHGPIQTNSRELDDWVILRKDGSPTYNFCCVIDDHAQGITHVVRGDDHIMNTFKQLLVYQALNAPPPIFAHIPMILGADGKRLSKRDGALSVLEYRDQGYLPTAVMNYLARLGWSHGDQEIFTREDLITCFSLDKVQKSPAIFDPVKLAWVNQNHLARCPIEELVALYRAFNPAIDTELVVDITQALLLYQSRIHTLQDLDDALAFAKHTTHPIDAAARRPYNTTRSLALLAQLKQALENVETWDVATLSLLIKSMAKENGVKMPELAMPLRIALAGSPNTPSIGALCALLGKDLCLERLTAFING